MLKYIIVFLIPINPKKLQAIIMKKKTLTKSFKYLKYKFLLRVFYYDIDLFCSQIIDAKRLSRLLFAL